MVKVKALDSANELLMQFADFINRYLDENGIQDFINDPEFATVLAIRFSKNENGEAAIQNAIKEIAEVGI